MARTCEKTRWQCVGPRPCPLTVRWGPKLNVTEGSVEAGYGVTAHGDPNTYLTAVLNVPLITDRLAVRAVIYKDRRGGYIDNVPWTLTRKNTDLGIY